MHGIVARKELATIKAGEQVSSPVSLSEAIAIGIVFPNEFTGTKLSYRVSHDPAGPFADLRSGASYSTVAVTPGAAWAYVSMVLEELLPWRYVQFVSDAPEAAQRVIEVHIK